MISFLQGLTGILAVVSSVLWLGHPEWEMYEPSIRTLSLIVLLFQGLNLMNFSTKEDSK